MWDRVRSGDGVPPSQGLTSKQDVESFFICSKIADFEHISSKIMFSSGVRRWYSGLDMVNPEGNMAFRRRFLL